jgi:hypothetical protein
VRITPTDPGRSLQLSYDVRLAGSEAAIPIAVPSTTLERADDSRGAQVDVAVDFDGGLTAARVLIPRLERSPAGTGWTARLLAMPAFVRVGVRSGSDPDLTPVRPQSRFSAEFRASCPGRIDGSTGRLEWRFVVFVATMGVWVPVYFWWFARRRGAQL